MSEHRSLMTRMLEHLLFVLILVLIAGRIGLCLEYQNLSDQQTSSIPPHIIVIIADDLGWNDVSFHGANQIPTPNIDALGMHGVILNRHYTLPICTPSRAAFLTGRYAIRTGMQGYPLKAAEPRGIPLDNTLLPEYLRQLGYATHLLGKWHVGYHTRKHGPTHRGFDTFFGYYNGYIEYFNHTLFESNQLGYDLHRITGDNHTVEYRYEYMTDLITEEAEDIILSHDPKKPLYLQVAHLAAHASDADEVMEVRNWEETNTTFDYIKDINRRKYASVVAALDQSVGRVVDTLKTANMLNNSIIVFISDNGAMSDGYLRNYGSNHPLRGLKFTLFEGGVRGVACIYSPLIESSSRVSDQLYHITDWLPTLYSAAGGDSNELKDLDGVDSWPAIKSAQNNSRETILLNIDEKNNNVAALKGYYKLVKETSLYGKHYGDSGHDNSYPAYNLTKVLTSLAGSAIASIKPLMINERHLMGLRERITLNCKVNEKLPACKERPCLFDLYKDPCEITDLSSEFPEIVMELSAFIDSYKSILMKQTNAPVDPAGFPREFNNVWMPWLPDDYQSINETHFKMKCEIS